MRRRILVAMLASVGVALIGFGVPLAANVAARDRDEALIELSAAAANAAVAVPGSFARDDDVPELPDPPHDIDLALYTTDGRRLLGEGPAEADPLVVDVLATGTAGNDADGLVVAIPVTDEERTVGAIRARFPQSTITARTRRTWAALAALAGGVFAFTALLSLRRSRALAAPLAQLEEDARHIGDGTSALEPVITGIGEIDTVHRSLQDAAARVDDALARERSFGVDIAHQLRTPLASLRLRLENDQVEAGPSPLVDDALRDVDRLEITIDDIIQLARHMAPAGEQRPLATLLHDVTDRWRNRLGMEERAFVVALEPELPWVHARPAAVRQILDVLIDNARVHGQGTITIEAFRRGAGAVVAVTDEGSTTVDPETAFARSRGAGSGIGLALARRLAEADDLRLVVAHPGPGPRFHLIFAATQPQTP